MAFASSDSSATLDVVVSKIMIGIGDISNSLDAHKNNLIAVESRLDQYDVLLKAVPRIFSLLEILSNEVAALKATTCHLEHENASLKRIVTDFTSKAVNLPQPGAPNAVSADVNTQRIVAAVNSHSSCMQRLGKLQAKSNELVISGLPDTSDQSNPLPLALAVASALSVPLHKADIDSIRFLKRSTSSIRGGNYNMAVAFSSVSAGSASTTSVASSGVHGAGASTQSSIVVKLKNPGLLKKLIHAKRLHGALKLSSIRCPTSVPPNGLVKDHTILVNERLPSHTYRLLGRAKATLKAAGFKYIWAQNNAVFAKFADGDLIHAVNSYADAEQLATLQGSTAT